MPYIYRDKDSNIIGFSKWKNNSKQDFLTDDDPEVVAFKNKVPSDEEIYNQTIQNSKVIKALVLSLNDGSFVPGAGISNSQLKTIILSKM